MGRSVIVLGAVGAVAATVVTAAALSSPERAVTETRPADTTTAPSPTPTPTPGASGPSPAPFTPAGRHEWRTTVPDHVSVSAGLPEDGGDFERVVEAVTWTFCGTEAFPEGDVLDVRRDGATGPEYADRRDLRVFADDRAAHAFLSRATAAAGDCPEEPHEATRWIHTVVTVDGLGEEAVRIVLTYETDGMTNVGATWWLATRVGNAVLLTATGGEYLPGQTLGQGIREHDELIAPVVDTMCVFAASGCTS